MNNTVGKNIYIKQLHENIICTVLENDVGGVYIQLNYMQIHVPTPHTCKLDAESRELRYLESRGPDVASRV